MIMKNKIHKIRYKFLFVGAGARAPALWLFFANRIMFAIEVHNESGCRVLTKLLTVFSFRWQQTLRINCDGVPLVRSCMRVCYSVRLSTIL